MMDRDASLLTSIEAFISARGTSATAFGYAVLKDPNFVHDLRNGRKVTDRTRRRVLRYLERKTKGQS